MSWSAISSALRGTDPPQWKLPSGFFSPFLIYFTLYLCLDEFTYLIQRRIVCLLTRFNRKAYLRVKL